MRYNLLPGLHYGVYLHTFDEDTLDAVKRAACVDLVKLAEALPHGSGINSDWTVELVGPLSKMHGSVTVYGSYHAMDEWGGYVGWKDFHFTIRQKKGQAKPTMGHVIGARSHNEYLDDTIGYDLHEAGLVE